MAQVVAGTQLIRLNLGCGSRKVAGYVNVDREGEPDLRVDLESFPWPWGDSVAEHVLLVHVLEHLGADPDTFRRVVQELYRVCAPGARVEVVVPHPRHDNFLSDPTHVRAITAQLMSLFDREKCLAWQAGGYSNTPLALHWGVDFRIVAYQEVPAEPYRTQLAEGRLAPVDFQVIARERNNTIEETRLMLEARK
ncbi:MAG: hypothetical protein KIS74_09100 [Burkholderiales bacterium]|nr:hypothetical protein [Burkholderiales bacterium]